MMENIDNLLIDAQKKKLKELNLHSWNLKTWPEKIFELVDLETLYISNNNLTSIPKEISKLKNLRYLNLNNNEISTLPSELIKLRRLEFLYLSSNKFKNFPVEILTHESLKDISLGSNYLKKLPEDFDKNLKLENLFLDNNSIRLLPKIFITNLELSSIALDQNPIESPPIEIANRGIPAIRNYFDSIDEYKETYKIFEAKLLIVGEGFVGKTCLMKKLLKPDALNTDDNNTTEGIEINQWYLKTKHINDFRINIWDFGGQEIYHSTHQFFLTKRSLYVFVWVARTDDDLISFDYWLNVIKLLSDNAPVLVVLNKIDERIKMIDELSVKSKFDNIKLFHKISVKTGEGVNELIKSIRNEIEELPHIGETVPKVWIDIRRELENSNKNFITLPEYYNLCKKYDLNEDRALYLSQYFHDLGVFLHFQEDDILRGIIFLKPEWATNAVYKVVDTKEIQKNYGKFTYKELKSIWEGYEDENFIQLIELMKKFELCFKLKKNTYLAPSLLSGEKPLVVNGWNYKENIKFEYHYDFMPRGIITRFIVRNSDLINDHTYWKNGVIVNRIEQYLNGKEITKEETFALIQSLPLERKIRINIRGKNKSVFLGIIRRELDYIHKTLNYPNVKEMIPCTCKYCSTSKDYYLWNYGELKIYIENNENSIFCTYGKERVEIDKLMKGISVKNNSQKSIENVNIKGGITYITDRISN